MDEDVAGRALGVGVLDRLNDVEEPAEVDCEPSLLREHASPTVEQGAREVPTFGEAARKAALTVTPTISRTAARK